MKELLKKLFSLQMLTLICILYATFFRCIGVFTQAWLDEIWAWNSVKQASSAVGFFAQVSFDGHASLYSLIVYYCWLFGFGIEVMRLPALLCSLATLYLIWIWCRQNNKDAATYCLAFCSFSYILTLYGSEARGYSSMLCFGLLALLYLEKALLAFCQATHTERIKAPLAQILIFGLSSYIAFLFHPSFVQFFAAMLLWLGFRLIRIKAKSLVYFFSTTSLLPGALICGTYWFYLRHLPSGGGSVRSYFDVLIETLSVAFGGPLVSPSSPGHTLMAILWALVVLWLLCLTIVVLYRKNDSRWFFYLMVIFVSPLCVTLLLEPKSLSTRYFLFSIIFSYAAISELLASAIAQAGRRKICGILFGLLCLLGFSAYQIEFFRFGRGQYKEALDFILKNSSTSIISAGGNHNFRNSMMLEFLMSKADLQGKTLSYQSKGDQANAWYLFETQDFLQQPSQELSDGFGGQYRLRASFYSAPFSGWNWFIYESTKVNDTKNLDKLKQTAKNAD